MKTCKRVPRFNNSCLQCKFLGPFIDGDFYRDLYYCQHGHLISVTSFGKQRYPSLADPIDTEPGWVTVTRTRAVNAGYI